MKERRSQAATRLVLVVVMAEIAALLVVQAVDAHVSAAQDEARFRLFDAIAMLLRLACKEVPRQSNGPVRRRQRAPLGEAARLAAAVR